MATQSRWLQHGLDPELKSVRCANYLVTLRSELQCLAHACGRVHPSLIPLEAIGLPDADLQSVRVDELFGYKPGWGTPGQEDVEAISALMA